MIKVAESCNAQKKHEEAETLAERSLAALAEALKAHKPRNATDELEQVDVSATLYDRAGNLFARNHKYQQAEAAYQQVVTIREKYVSNASPTKPNNEDFLRFLAQNLSNSQDKLADANSKLARLYCTEQKLQDAESFFKKAIVLKEKQYGADQPQVTESLTELATCYSQQSAYAKAEPLYTRVIAILEQSRVKDKAPMAVALDNYALLLRKTSREAEAKPFLERANAIRAKSEITKQ